PILEIIGNTSLANLSGLENLTSIGQILEIYYNTNLTSIQSLSSITHVGKDIRIIDNHILTNLNGLNNVNTLNNGNLELTRNYALVDFSVLSNFTSIKGLSMFDMPELNDFS